MKEGYERYHIATKKAANILAHPHRFSVKVSKIGLAKLLLREFFHYKGRFDVIASRPCVYGVFSGPVGGFSPREEKCVGCLRCTTQYPDIVQILRNPAREALNDFGLTPEQIDTLIYEAETGRVPVKGAGFRGKFGGIGWDGMWTDMSEIVRPTRDGIHGRETISTEVDIGEKPKFLKFDAKHQLKEMPAETVKIPIPFFFDAAHELSGNETYLRVLSDAAGRLKTFAVLPFESIIKFDLKASSIIPLLEKKDIEPFIAHSMKPALIEMSEWDAEAFQILKSQFPSAQVILRGSFDDRELLNRYADGVRIFHLFGGEKFIADSIRRVHLKFHENKCRGDVTLIGSGAIDTAEHLPKAMICGLDAVGLNIPLLVALQVKKDKLPKGCDVQWGIQRLLNLAGAWRDQLLEILGAMGLREVRRLRGEMGRAMLQKELEAEAFKGIAGYETR